MDFVLISLAVVAAIAGILVLLARAYPGSGADLLDWQPSRSYETEIELEAEDVRQMIDAQNEYRARRGAEPIDEESYRLKIEEEERRRHAGG